MQQPEGVVRTPEVVHTASLVGCVTQRGSLPGERSSIPSFRRFFHGARNAILLPSGDIVAPERTGGPKKSSTEISGGTVMIRPFVRPLESAAGL